MPADRKFLLLTGSLLLAVLAAYANHFRNEFHFDDFHTITRNPAIESLSNITRFFVDGTLFSTVVTGAVYRPLVSTSLALDYRLGGGRDPLYFHLSTFLWYLVQLAVMFAFFRRIMDRTSPNSTNLWIAWFAAALYGLHPANAETVNYIIQRGDLYSTLGVVASIAWFSARPSQRKYGWYLLPAVAAFLSKPPALIYPFLLLAYVFLIEEAADWRRSFRTLKACAPAFVVTAVGALLTARMTPPGFVGGATSASLYRLTQPWVALHYFLSFFLPTGLSIDNGQGYVSGAFSGEAVLGDLFVAALLAAVIYTARRSDTRPVAFGLVWFVLALLPTSLMPLADLSNDHRMFFPFVGLALAVGWGAWLMAVRLKVGLKVAGAVAVVVLVAAAAGTVARNQVWRTEESVWLDAMQKNPRNGRGPANYGQAFLNRGDFSTAYTYLSRAATLMPASAALETALGRASAGLYNEEAARHFELAERLDRNDPQAFLEYGRWLKDKGQLPESQSQLESAMHLDPRGMDARHLLMEIFAGQSDWAALDALVKDTLEVSAQDATARRYLAEKATRQPETAESLLNRSAQFCNSGRYDDCLSAAQEALKLRPRFAEAYGNMAAALISMERWDEGIQAARQSLAIKPDNDAARSNLQWALQHKPKPPK